MNNSDFLVFCDVETSGVSFAGNDPSFDPFKRERFSIVSLAAVITDRSFRVIDEFYSLSKFDSSIFTWQIKAQQIHGLSISFLAKEGVEQWKLADDFNHFLLKNSIDTSRAIHFVGHNFRGFDFYFIDFLMGRFSKPLKFAGRCFDSNSLCLLTGTNDSTELFEKLGISREQPHNALSDCKATIEAFKKMTKKYGKLQIL